MGGLGLHILIRLNHTFRLVPFHPTTQHHRPRSAFGTFRHRLFGHWPHLMRLWLVYNGTQIYPRQIGWANCHY